MEQFARHAKKKGERPKQFLKTDKRKKMSTAKMTIPAVAKLLITVTDDSARETMVMSVPKLGRVDEGFEKWCSYISPSKYTARKGCEAHN